IIAAPGVDLVGPLPAAIQNYTLFAGGLVAASKEQEAGKGLLRFISSPAAQGIWKGQRFSAPPKRRRRAATTIACTRRAQSCRCARSAPRHPPSPRRERECA